jgi:RNA polymerase sigma factor (sigma-70 family)
VVTTSQGAVERPADEDLVARLRAGDEDAFRDLVTRHRPWLVRLCTRLLGNDAHAAEDAAQESLLKLHTAAGRDARPLRVRPWLSVVARRTCVDEYRRRRADLPGELPEQPAVGEGPFHLDPALDRAWSQLAGRHREVLYLREVVGLSYKEIATVMDLSLASVETLIFRARGALRREYERAGGRHFGCGLLGLGLFGLAAGDRRLQAAAHVAGCEHCRQAVDGLRTAGNLLRMSAPAVDMVSSVGAKLSSGTGLDLAGGFDLGSLSQRAVHVLTAALPDGGQAVARLISTAAGVAMAAASVIPALVVPLAPGRPGRTSEVVAAGAAAPARSTTSASRKTGGSAATTGRPVPAWSESLRRNYPEGAPTDSGAVGDKAGPRSSVSPGKAPRPKKPAVEGVDRPRATPAARPVLAPGPTPPSPEVVARPPQPPPDAVSEPEPPSPPRPDVDAPPPPAVPETPDVAAPPVPEPPVTPPGSLVGRLGDAVPLLS